MILTMSFKGSCEVTSSSTCIIIWQLQARSNTFLVLPRNIPWAKQQPARSFVDWHTSSWTKWIGSNVWGANNDSPNDRVYSDAGMSNLMRSILS